MNRRKRGAGLPVLSENDHFSFPDPVTADPSGIVAVGGNLSPGMLLSAYRQGIFPWFSRGEPILWWSPDPRFVVFPDEVRVSASMRKLLRKEPFSYSLDRRFGEVIEACAAARRPDQSGTWITRDMIRAYEALHRLGYAHSVEVYRDGELCGGLYGISLGGVFFGESMFSAAPNASKAAFILFGAALRERGFGLIDSQVETRHVAGLGGRNIPRREFLRLLGNLLSRQTLKGNWEELFPGFPRAGGINT